MKRLFKFLTSVVLAAGLVSCAAVAPAHQAASATPVPEPNVEVGNSTYIPIDQYGTLESNIEAVFAAVDKWEKAHPNREIVDLDYVQRQSGYAISAYTFGVIIYSRSR